MFFVFGFGHRKVKHGGTMPPERCERCNNNVEKLFAKTSDWFTLFFIPVFPYKSDCFVICPICREATPITKEQYEALLSGDHDKLKYDGKTEVQINYLKQMEQIERERIEEIESGKTLNSNEL